MSTNRLGVRTGQWNQAGATSPRDGEYSCALARSLARGPDPVTISPLPLFHGHAYRNYVGALLVRGVQDKAIVPGMGYKGIAPAMLQPTIDRPDPWATAVL